MSRRGPGEGSVYRRKDGRWVAQVRDDTGRARYEYHATQAEAQSAKLRMLNERESGQWPQVPERLTLGDFLAYWLETCVKPPNRRHSTYASYRQVVDGHLDPVLGNVSLKSLRSYHVDRLLSTRRASGLELSTVAKILRVLRTALGKAHDWGFLREPPGKIVALPRLSRPRQPTLTLAQARRLREALRGDPYEGVYLLGLTLGLRWSEIVGLRWTDIDYEARTLRIERQLYRVNRAGWREEQAKTDAGHRTLPLTDDLVGVLGRHWTAQRARRARSRKEWAAHEQSMFTGQRGRHLDHRWVTSRLHGILEQAGLPDMTFHHLRHAAGSLLMADGVPIKVIQEILGHAEARTTANIYLHTQPDQHERAIQRLGQLLEESGEKTP